MHDSLSQSAGTVLEADFYHADQLLPQSDEDLVAKVSQSSQSGSNMAGDTSYGPSRVTPFFGTPALKPLYLSQVRLK